MGGSLGRGVLAAESGESAIPPSGGGRRRRISVLGEGRIGPFGVSHPTSGVVWDIPSISERSSFNTPASSASGVNVVSTEQSGERPSHRLILYTSDK